MSATDSAAGSTPPTSPPPQAAPHTVHVVHPAPSRFQGLGAVVLMVGSVIVLGVTGLFLWQMSINANRPQAAFATVGDQGDIASLRDRLASDEARIAALERGGNAGAKASIDQMQATVAALSARVAKLETMPDPAALSRLEDIERRLSAMRGDIELRVAALERNALTTDVPQRLATITTDISALMQRIAHLEAIDPNVTMKRAAAELALANLVAVSSTDQGFAVELQTFRTLMPTAPEAGELAPIALRGVPTQRTLNERFADMAAKALAAEKAGHATTWLGRLWANFSNLIVIRRVGETAGQDSESILARAGVRLDKGDLAGALTEMKALKGAARASATPWLNDAKSRHLIQTTNAILAKRLMALLASP